MRFMRTRSVEQAMRERDEPGYRLKRDRTALDLTVSEEMVNIGTLPAFLLVSLSIPVLRRTRPDLQRPFKVPRSPWLSWLSAAICALLMLNLSGATWIRFLAWLAAGLALYGLYGYRRSRLAAGAATAP